jgi:hypothetical protein
MFHPVLILWEKAFVQSDGYLCVRASLWFFFVLHGIFDPFDSRRNYGAPPTIPFQNANKFTRE